MIKLIVCDMDGTILNKDNTLDEQSYQKILEKSDQGVEFIWLRIYVKAKEFIIL